jgi:hypothetical protein
MFKCFTLSNRYTPLIVTWLIFPNHIASSYLGICDAMLSYMFTLISYKMKRNGIETSNHEIRLTVEWEIIESRFWNDKSISCIQTCKFDTLEDARKIQSKLRAN